MKNTVFDSGWCNEFLVWEKSEEISVGVQLPTYLDNEGEIFVNLHAAEAAWCDDFLQGVKVEMIESVSTVFQEYSGY